MTASLPAKRLILVCLLGFFALLLSRCVPTATPAAAFEIPYGVQDPFQSPGFPSCAGGEIGYWQFLVRPDSQDPKAVKVWLVLTTVDFLDPALVICYVPSDRKILVMEPGKDT